MIGYESPTIEAVGGNDMTPAAAFVAVIFAAVTVVAAVTFLAAVSYAGVWQMVGVGVFIWETAAVVG